MVIIGVGITDIGVGAIGIGVGVTGTGDGVIGIGAGVIGGIVAIGAATGELAPMSYSISTGNSCDASNNHAVALGHRYNECIAASQGRSGYGWSGR